MPRVRWAVPCRAHRTDGSPCRAYAIRGGRVCRAHGGASPNARQVANTRMILDDFHRAFDREAKTLGERKTAWRVNRIIEAARHLEMDPVEVARSPVLVGFAEGWGKYSPPPAPERRDDHRFRVHRPGYAMAEAIPGVVMRAPARGHHEPYCAGWPRPGGRMCIEELRVVFDDLGRQLGRVR
ncbi:hypothetical protein [Parafrankia soli]|uniref:hypothetical protein n=1 Tax=Parafrankia soli TaxID=2599596 RepID=UPI0010422915|nr:hypothetical protein [Parafrankia soli]